jgi:LmbE family N-acetylglucosaminyl deacetylase
MNPPSNVTRRHFLLGLAALLPVSTAFGADNRPGKLRVVVFGGHPDDPESGAGGLIALLTQAGHEVLVGYATTFRTGRSFKGEPEGEVRQRESRAACKLLGATPKFFPYAHEKLEADPEAQRAVVAWLDEVKPDIVVTHWLFDTHPNHHVAGSLIWRAYAKQGGWNLYCFEVETDQQSRGFVPQLYLDISAVHSLKHDACYAHVSQNPDEFWRLHEAMHHRRGAECGVALAEAFYLVEAKPGRPLLPVTFLPRKNL